MEQSKSFFEVFPTLSINNRLNGLFKEVYIKKITSVKSKKQLNVYMESEHLIYKQYICEMEEVLTQYLSKNYGAKVVLIEQYHLSQLYDLSKLIEMYRDSLLFELGKMSRVSYNILAKGEWHGEENVLTLVLENTFLAKEKSLEIKEFIQNRMKSRFNMDISVGFDFSKEHIEILTKHREHKIALEVAAVEQKVKERKEEEELHAKNVKKQEGKKRAGQSSGFNKVEKQEKKGNDAYSKAKQEQYHQRNFRDEDVIYGKNCEGELSTIQSIDHEVGEVVVEGLVRDYEEKELKNGRSTIVSFAITDFTDTIKGKLFVKNEMLNDLKSEFEKGKFYRIKGIAAYDSYDREIELTSISGIKRAKDKRGKRMDTALEKRVELHLHTKMSDMDSVVDIKEMIATAKAWGHKAVAITDHGVVQAFPIANHQVSPDEDFKILYGVEGYFIDDVLELVEHSKGQQLTDSYVVFDLETTGFLPSKDKIIEIGAVKVVNGEVVDEFSEFVNPERPIPYEIEQLTSINDRMVVNAPTIEEILPRFIEFCKGSSLVAHNAEFDTSFIKANCEKLDLEYDFTVVDTLSLARVLLKNISKFALNNVCNHLKITQEHHHRAVDDAAVTSKIFLRFVEMLNEQGITNLDQVNEMGSTSVDKIKKSPYYHGIILVKNEIGRVNLYRLISESHLTYYHKRPRMPKSLIEKYREGLIIGSACEAGELYRAILHEKGPEKIAKIVSFYDYLEIQPLGNNEFMIRDPKNPVKSNEDLIEINKKIVALGEEYNKPVVATCDVHFLNPEDSIYRTIIMTGKGFKDADQQPPLYLHTTEEMLEEFSYLGSEKAKEVVITNTNLIADMIEKISPVYPDKCPPQISNSEQTLTDICYTKAHEIYGPNLPEIVQERLTRELDSIIGNGFAVMYIIAQKLVWDSRDHGYLVGSRGSVGSSFVANMAGITEVNSLQAHYLCPKCYYVDFDSDLVKSFSGNSGCDMPDRDCPVCGTPLKKDGHDIPFETFLGFNGDKEPDIDLNFSGEYQANAHKYTEELFGKGHAFRAGTVGTVADKTAEGYVYNYFKDIEAKKIRNQALAEGKTKKAADKLAEEAVVTKRRCEISRLAEGCIDVKRTTGQHPGGIIVVPHDMEIYTFTPIQRPANDEETDIITTHFEYHSIDHNLLKLDNLGHDDPTIIKHLEEMTDTDAKLIPLDDKDVMSLFHGTKALGITPEDIGGCPLGCLGIPEFGTDFVIKMLLDTKPKSFSDLVRISGLSHGTDVWTNNAQVLIEEGKTELSNAICCRDDIMVYLIHMGLDKGHSFKIMEGVRKGKGLSPEQEQEMMEHGVPDWYIWSCKKIKYMFPKAHAAAYVMMAWRIAYYKVNYPRAYYTAFFSIRAKDMNYETMCLGPDILEYHLKQVQSIPKNKRTAKEEGTLRDMKLVQEMYARGIDFLPIDIYEADDKYFKIIDDKIMPALNTIDGLGDNAAETIKAAAKEAKEGREFLSQEDFRIRAKAPKAVVEKMANWGMLGDVPESNQFTFQF